MDPLRGAPFDEPALLAVAGIVAAGLLTVMGLVVFGWVQRVQTASLRRLGYLPGPNTGEWTARLDPLRITWRPGEGFFVRLGAYSMADVRIRPRPSSGSAADFEVGVPELDARFVFASDSPEAAMDVFGHPRVQQAMLKFPPVPVDLRGDELKVQVRRQVVGRPIHDGMLRLAVALAAAIAR